MALCSCNFINYSCIEESTDSVDSSGTLSSAFADFNKSNVTITQNGSNAVIKTNALPNHSSPYWSNTTPRTKDGITTKAATSNHPLFIAPDKQPIITTSFANMAPGNIDDFNGSYTLTVPLSPKKASSSTATGLGPIGIAVSGAMIYNVKKDPI